MSTDTLEAAVLEAGVPTGSIEVKFTVQATTEEDGNIVVDSTRAPTREIAVRIEFGNRRILKIVYPPQIDGAVQQAIDAYAKRLVGTVNKVDSFVECMLPGEVVNTHTEPR